MPMGEPYAGLPVEVQQQHDEEEDLISKLFQASCACSLLCAFWTSWAAPLAVGVHDWDLQRLPSDA